MSLCAALPNRGGLERDTADGYLLRPPCNPMIHRSLGPDLPGGHGTVGEEKRWRSRPFVRVWRERNVMFVGGRGIKVM